MGNARLIANYEDWQAGIEIAVHLLAAGDEAAFRKHMRVLGFDDDETEEWIRSMGGDR